MKQSHLLRGLWFIGEFSEIDYNKLVQGRATNAAERKWVSLLSDKL
jgi:hypothetical protein